MSQYELDYSFSDAYQSTLNNISRNEWEVRNACLSLSAGLDNIEIYKYIDTDFIATWRLMSPADLSSEDFLDTITIYSTYDVCNNNRND
ncbi:hypothetical protein [Morganella sp. GD04133]|uniref:hypothetical protein n=1 Tax=Morganella sp. GD04133 TaxID=2975435 RepID=UPI0024499598|nr:hypothetical protein [Morganella sp. GD04133]MDH0354907.1 hypothetical protein [Morganella sp. GD04133]